MCILVRIEMGVFVDIETMNYLKKKMKEQGWFCNSLMLDPSRCYLNFDHITIDGVGTLKLENSIPSVKPIYISLMRSWITGAWSVVIDYQAGITERHQRMPNKSIRRHVKVKPRGVVSV